MTKEELNLLKMSNYTLASHFSRNLGRGGGVMILVHKNINFKCIEIPPSINVLLIEKQFELCLTEIKTHNFCFVLGCIYRSPISSNIEKFLESLEIVLDILCKKYKQVVISGDYNIDVLNKNDTYKKFVNILDVYGMKYLVNFPTRVTPHSKTAIDNFITNIDPNCLKVTGVVTQISDHDGQLMEMINVKSENRILTRKQVRKFDYFNTGTFCRDLSSESWFQVYVSIPGLKYDSFYSIFTYYFNVNFPKKYVTEKPYKASQWIGEDLKIKQNEIVSLESQFRMCKEGNLKLIIANKKRELRSEVVTSKKMYFEDRIMNSKNKIKTTWNIINSEAGKPSKLDTNIKLFQNGHYLTDPIAICDAFNKFFVNVVNDLVIPKITSENTINNLSYHPCLTNTKFEFVTVSKEEVEKIVLSFENKYSAGNDEIPITVVKAALPLICTPLTHIINHSLISGIFPERFKIAKVIPIFKKGNTEDINCYRPISLLPVFSKILEKVVYNQFYNYLETNQLLDPEQHGFRSNKSTITAGIEFIESIIDSVDKGEKVIGIFLDLSRAFDSVEHGKLVEVLRTLGVNSTELTWFKSYLSERKQFVELDYYINHSRVRYKEKFASQLLTVQYGVPQGSILGPLLFLCYLKGLPGAVWGRNNKLCLYADDTNVIVTADNEEDIEISSCIGLSLIKDFLNSKNLLLNSNKSNFVSFSTKQARSKLCPTIFVEEEILNQVEETKFLGLIIDENLSWAEHINHVIRKTSSGLYALRRMAQSCNIETLKTIYYALIHSHISYGICIYGATTKFNLDRILLQQKRALRVMLNLKQKETVKHLFTELKIFTVYSLFIYESIKYIFLNKKIEVGNSLHPYNTRAHRMVHQHRLEFFKKKTSFKGNKFFDCLPENIKQERNQNTFLNMLKKFLIDSPVYSLEDFLSQ